MSSVTFDVQYTEPRDRLTSAFRYILAIPHMVISGVWSYLVQVLSVIQWFIILFTGQRNEGIWKLQRSWLAYTARVTGYEALLFDPWPKIGEEPGSEPTTFRLDFVAEANRLTNALRLLWMIPALILLMIISIGAFFVAIASWFAILFTGVQPRGMFDFLLRSVRFYVRFSAYSNLMIDDYPKYEGSEPTGVAAGGGGFQPPTGSAYG